MPPGVGAAELIVIAAVALIVVGPKDLPLLMRKIGGFMSRMRGLASEFRASFDEMARQAELDDLRKEVDALRGGGLDLGARADLEGTFRTLDEDLAMPGVSATAPLGPHADEAAREAVDDLEEPELPFASPGPEAGYEYEPELPFAPVSDADPERRA
jgi:sec-independent protein translocase protein TatB